ncbi:pH-response regulator protein palA/rim20 [Thecaphora frezii]
MPPRNILALPPKRTPSLAAPLSQAIRTYISQHYTDTHPDAFAADIREFCRLRDACTSLEPHVASIDAALRYHAQLVFFSTKFPQNIGIAFPWSLAFPPSLPLWTTGLSNALDAATSTDAAHPSAKSYATADAVAHPDLAYERANLLFSLASLYSALGTTEPRSESESIKRAIAYFQHAAGIFDHIREALLPDLRYLAPPSPDLGGRLLEALRDLMLAQAQECFWQKAVLDRLKNNTIAKLAERVAELYASALELATALNDDGHGADAVDAVRPQLSPEWIGHVTVKRWHFAAAAQYRKSCDDLGANRYGDELGRLKVAEGHVKRALDAARRGVSEAIVQDLKSLQQIIQTNTQRGTKDNDLIYLEPVTPATNLAPIVAASMVKPVLPSEVADAVSMLHDAPAAKTTTGTTYGRPLFAELVPYGVHMAISIYDDRKDTLVRELAERRDELDAVAHGALQSLNLPGSLQALEQPMGLPPLVLRRREEVTMGGGVEALERMADDVARIAKTDGEMLDEATSMLDDEEREDAEVRETFSRERWRRAPSAEAARELREQAHTYRQTLEQARRSDGIVRQKLEDWRDVIGVLAGEMEDLEAFVPSSHASASSHSSGGGAGSTIRTLRRELETLDDILDSRSACVVEAQNLASSDEIRSVILSHPKASQRSVEAADFEDVFETQLRKYDRFGEEMRRSESEQEGLLGRVEEANRRFEEERERSEEGERRRRALQVLLDAHARWVECRANLKEGLEFYNGLAKLLAEFRRDVKEWVRARQIDVHSLTASFQASSIAAPAPSSPAAKRGELRSTQLPRGQQPQQSPQFQQQQHQPQLQDHHQQQEQNDQQRQPPPSPPKWGAFPGGEIRFGN